MENWNSTSSKIQSSVGQIFVEMADYDFSKPYRPPQSDSVRGSSFVISHYKNEIYLLTNAHVVDGAINIKIRFMQTGKTNFTAKLVAFCPWKDIALVKILNPTKELLNTALPLKIADSAQVSLADNVIVAGYPLGEENIQFAKGNVSGYHAGNDEKEEEETSYIQITAPLNPGNSGGPVFNTNNEVIGIAAAGFMFHQNIGYAIPTRTVLAVLVEMIRVAKEDLLVIIYQPKLDFKWSTGSNQLCYKIMESDTCQTYTGINIRSVYPTSCLSNLTTYDDDFCQKVISITQHLSDEKDIVAVEMVKNMNEVLEQKCPDRIPRTDIKSASLLVDDILLEMSISNIYTEKTFDVPTLFEDNVKYTQEGRLTFKFDNNGQAVVEDSKYINRKLNLMEISDMIPYNSKISVKVLRKKNIVTINNIPYYPREVILWMVNNIYPRFEPHRFRYVIFAGLCVSQLVYQHDSTEIKVFLRPRIYGKYLVITTLFKGGILDDIHSLENGDILTHVNDKSVKTIDELIMALKDAKTQKLMDLKFMNGVKVVLDTQKVIESDRNIIQEYEIPINEQSKEWLL